MLWFTTCIAVHITSAHVHVESSEMTMYLGSVRDRPNADVFQGKGWCCWYLMLHGDAIDFLSVSEVIRAFNVTVVADFVSITCKSTPSGSGQSQAKARDRSSFNLGRYLDTKHHSLAATLTTTSSLDLHTKPHQVSTLLRL